jgi:peptidoglycan/xylan/chitin deacetylase (PgdA/CDA1 family)
MKTKRICKLILFLAIASLFSCVPKNTTPQGEDDLSITFKSDKHILYTLSKDMRPSLIAQKLFGDKDKAWIIEDSNKKARYLAGETIMIPLSNDNRAGLFKMGYQTIPILCYHRFAKECTSQLCAPEEIFDRQMKYLKENGYRVISLEMLQGYLEYKTPLPEKSVIITIDDGYKSVYEVALPILKKYNFTASLFIYTDFVAGGSAMTWEQIKTVKAAGFEIGSHTISHSDLTVKKPGESDEDYTRRITGEIVHSKQILDKKLDQETLFFAFPFGSSNPQVNRICKNAGYTLGLTVNRGGNTFFKDPFLLHRDQILSREQDVFISSLNTFKLISLENKDNE